MHTDLSSINRKALQKALTEAGVAHVDLSYSYRYSNDEGSTSVDFVRAKLKDGTDIARDQLYPGRNAYGHTLDPANPFASQVVFQTSEYKNMGAEGWKDVPAVQILPLADALVWDELVIGEEHAVANGEYEDDRDYDSDPESSHYSHKGFSRLTVANWTLSAIDAQGVVLEPVRRHYPSARRW